MVEKEVIMKALKKVMDPELGINIVELGLIYTVKERNGEAYIDMTLTSPGCPVAPQIMASVEQEVGRIKGINKVRVEFVFDPPWSPEKMSDEAKMELGI